MPVFTVTLPDSSTTPLLGNARTRIVQAVSSAEAIVAAKASTSFDSDSAWDGATATELTQQQDLIGIEFRATVSPDSSDLPRVFSAIGKAAITAATCTITLDTAGIVTLTAHGFAQGDPVVFATAGTLPTGITAGTTYYVNLRTANTFAIAAKVGGADIATTVSQTGAHTVRRVESSTVTGLLTQLAAVLNGSALIDLGTDVAVSGLVLTFHADSKVGDRAITFGSFIEGVATSGIIGTVNATGAEAATRTITISGGTMEGSRLRYTAAGANAVDVSVFLHAGESIDLAAARLVVLMAATTLLGANVTYGGANTITIAGAANAGDRVMTCTWTREGAAIPELAVTVSAVGAAGAARTLILAADGVLPVPARPISRAAALVV
jgi:hypothetical protein